MRKILAIALLLLMRNACAVTPGYYLITTYENDGLAVLDFNFWSVKVPNSPAVYAPDIGFGYGVTPSWYTELYANDIHTASTGTEFSSLSWQNDYLLTHGQFPVDVAVHTQITRYHQTANGLDFEFGPVLQGDIGWTQLNANVFFERDYRTEQANTMQIKYQWQAKYRWKPAFQFGLQGFGELGNWRDWSPYSQQSNRAGPAVFAKLLRNGNRELKLEASYLFGKIFDREARTFALRASYEF